MEEAKNRLMEDVYQGICLGSLFVILLFLCIVVLIIITFVCFSKFDIYGKIALPIICVGLIILLCLLTYLVHLEYKDYEYWQSNGGPIYIEGELIGFENEYWDEAGMETHKYNPIIRISGTNEEITLRIHHSEKRMKIGETYEIVYLPNTKNAEIIE